MKIKLVRNLILTHQYVLLLYKNFPGNNASAYLVQNHHCRIKKVFLALAPGRFVKLSVKFCRRPRKLSNFDQFVDVFRRKTEKFRRNGKHFELG
jgi:hypothetical protein